jgi:hypothetical protein
MGELVGVPWRSTAGTMQKPEDCSQAVGETLQARRFVCLLSNMLLPVKRSGVKHQWVLLHSIRLYICFRSLGLFLTKL